MENTTFWGIITARKGSTRLINKNKLKLINKPLIEYSYISAINSNLDKVILTTDCEDSIGYAKKYPSIDIPFIRPSELCESESKTLDVVRHCLTHYKNNNIELPEFVVILQPTSPQRTTENINYLIDYMKSNKELNGLSTISMNNNQANKSYYMNNNILHKVTNNGDKLYSENGILFIVRTSFLFNDEKINNNVNGSLPYDNIELVHYPKKTIVDIDIQEDLDFVEFLMKQENKKIERNEIKIGNRIINQKSRPFFIAEIGINHEADMKKAIKMVYDAYYSGAECVKFQCHIPHAEMTKEATNIIPSNADKNIFDIIDGCSLSEEQELYIKNIVESLGMIYLCTPFSIEAADRLEKMNVLAYKIGSGEMNNLQLVEHVAKFGKPLLISTGMNPLHKIRKTVELVEKYNVPYCLFHCVSIYPTPYDKVNLPGIDDLMFEFPRAIIGLSDHSIGISSCFGAYMKGAQIIEKHYTSYKEWDGPDIEISITPQQLKDVIIHLDELKECNKGDGRVEIQKEEQGTIDFAFCTLTATSDLKAGHILNEKDLIAKRPNIGDFLAEDIPKLIGKTLKKNVYAGEKIYNDSI